MNLFPSATVLKEIDGASLWLSDYNLLVNYRYDTVIHALRKWQVAHAENDRILTQKLDELIAINQAINALENPLERKIIPMRFREGLTIKKIADLTQCNVSQVQNIYNQGVKKLTS